MVFDVSSYLSPSSLWSTYVTYLWYYSSNSWVSRIASTFRALSFLVILPITVLALLDIASYVIARTLGVVEVSKASTSDVSTIHHTGSISSEAAASASTSLVPGETASSTPNIIVSSSSSSLVPSQDNNSPTSLRPHSFFASEENQLSGAGIFSPAASRAPSPTLSRRHLKDDLELKSRPASITSSSLPPSPTMSRRQVKEDWVLPSGGNGLDVNDGSISIRRRKV